MDRILRLLRGLVGMGLTFAAGLSAVFSVVVVLKWLLFGADLGYEMIETVLTGVAPAGFVMGVTFAAGLAAYGRRRSFSEISFTSFAVLGASAGIIMSCLVDGGAVLLASLGAGSGVCALGLARRAGSPHSADEAPTELPGESPSEALGSGRD